VVSSRQRIANALGLALFPLLRQRLICRARLIGPKLGPKAPQNRPPDRRSAAGAYSDLAQDAPDRMPAPLCQPPTTGIAPVVNLRRRHHRPADDECPPDLPLQPAAALVRRGGSAPQIRMVRPQGGRARRSLRLNRSPSYPHLRGAPSRRAFRRQLCDLLNSNVRVMYLTSRLLRLGR
jgi:hypothetical protein